MSRALVIAFVMLVAGCVTQSLPHGPWLRYDIGNVQIISGAKEQRTRELAESVRRFQVVAAELTTAPVVEPIVPTRVYVFPDDYTYKAITGSRDTAGVFRPGIASNLIVLTGESEDEEVLFHEYTHFVTGNDPNTDYPAWYREGLAEVLSTVQFDRDRVHLGRMPNGYDPVAVLDRWIPLRDILREDYRLIDDDYSRSQFYRQSWLLVHYGMFGVLAGKTDRGEQLETLLSAIDDGAHPVVAAEAAFGVPLREVERELKAYLRESGLPYLSYPLQRFAFPTAPLARAEVAPEHVGAHMAFVAANFRQRETAVRLAWEASSAGDDSAIRSLALAIAESEERQEAAYNHFERARKLAPDDVEVLTVYAAWLVGVAENAPNPNARRVRLQMALAVAEEAVARRPNHGAGHYVLGLAALGLGGEHNDRALASLSQALELWPGHDAIALNLGLACLAAGRIDRGRELLQRVARANPGRHIGVAAREALARLDAADGAGQPSAEVSPRPSSR